MTWLMDQIKVIIFANPCLALRKNDVNNVIIRTDISNFGIGIILQQISLIKDSPSQDLILAYFSKIFHRTETQYNIDDKELLAIKELLSYCRSYLLG
jgi:hypothetical protein